MFQATARKAFLVTGMATLVAGAVAADVKAASLRVNVSGQDYDITTIETTYNTSTSLLQSQIWWNNEALARSFASAVNTQLGLQTALPVQNFGPYFAYEPNNINSIRNVVWNFQNSTVGTITSGLTDSRFYATATAVPIPTPALLPGLIGMGIAAVRKRQSVAEKAEA